MIADPSTQVIHEDLKDFMGRIVDHIGGKTKGRTMNQTIANKTGYDNSVTASPPLRAYPLRYAKLNVFDLDRIESLKRKKRIPIILKEFPQTNEPIQAFGKKKSIERLHNP